MKSTPRGPPRRGGTLPVGLWGPRRRGRGRPPLPQLPPEATFWRPDLHGHAGTGFHSLALDPPSLPSGRCKTAQISDWTLQTCQLTSTYGHLQKQHPGVAELCRRVRPAYSLQTSIWSEVGVQLCRSFFWFSRQVGECRNRGFLILERCGCCWETHADLEVSVDRLEPVCRLCKVTCTSQDTLLGHAGGAKHIRRVNFSSMPSHNKIQKYTRSAICTIPCKCEENSNLARKRQM